MYKAAYAVIGDDRVLLKTFSFDDGGSLLNPNESDLLSVFLQNPEIVDISNLGYIPKISTTYADGVFNSTEDDKNNTLPNKLTTEDIKCFSLIVEGVHRGVYAFSTNSNNGAAKAAMLLSSPSIQVDTVDE